MITPYRPANIVDVTGMILRLVDTRHGSHNGSLCKPVRAGIPAADPMAVFAAPFSDSAMAENVNQSNRFSARRPYTCTGTAVVFVISGAGHVVGWSGPLLIPVPAGKDAGSVHWAPISERRYRLQLQRSAQPFPTVRLTQPKRPST